MKRLLILIVPAFLAACANTGVVPMDRGVMMISKDSAKVGGGISMAVRAEVYQEANAHCAKAGRTAETLDLLMQPGMPGRLGNVTLQFRCVINHGEGQAVRLQREADLVIETRQR